MELVVFSPPTETPQILGKQMLVLNYGNFSTLGFSFVDQYRSCMYLLLALNRDSAHAAEGSLEQRVSRL